MEDIVDRFTFDSFIGSGAYGKVYKGRDEVTGDLVAIKIEKERRSTFDLEAKIYKTLKGVVGFPNLRWNGPAFEGNMVMVLDLLGDNLHYLSRERCNGTFSLKTVAVIADQLLQRLQALHERGYIHRDLKPDNIVMGRGDAKHIVHLIDFGIAAKLPCSGNYCGYLPFASARMHRNESLSAWDDLESLGYILIFLLKGSLPWSRFKGQSHSRAVLKSKMTALDDVLHNMHSSFAVYMKYVRGDHYAPVNYTFLRLLFSQIHSPPGQIQNEHIFDWELQRNTSGNRLPKLDSTLVNPIATAAPAKNIPAPLVKIRVDTNLPARPMEPFRVLPEISTFVPQSSAPLCNKSCIEPPPPPALPVRAEPSVCAAVPVVTLTLDNKNAAPSSDAAAREARMLSVCALTDRYTSHCRLERSRSANLLARASALSRGAQRGEPARRGL